ncbi:MAG: hypothetical protein ACTSRP_09365 [Candidatus Helarchaeota archaeon]
MELKLVEIPEICPVCNNKIVISFKPTEFKEGKGGLWQFALKCPHLGADGEEHIIVVNIDRDFKVRRKYGYPLVYMEKLREGEEDKLIVSKRTNDLLLKMFKNEALKWAIYGNEFEFFLKNAETLRIKLISNVDEIAKMNNPKISMRFVHMLDENKKLINYMEKLADIQYFMEFLITLIYLERVKAVEFLLD